MFMEVIILMVSVIIPVYNTREEYLQKCIDSVLKQTYQNIEVIIIDDGSNNKTCKICDLLPLKDKRIVVYHKENGGVSSARNLGLYRSNGEYVMFIDSDDWVEPSYIENMLLNMSNEVDLTICNILSNNVENEYDKVIELNQEETYEAILKSKEIGGYMCNKLFKKKLITHIFDEKIHYCEDFVFIAEYCKNIRRSRFIDLNLYHYTYTEDSATSSFNYNTKILSLMDAYYKIEDIYKIFASNEVDLIKKNALKIALNLRSRYKINRINNTEEYEKINNTIKKYMRDTISNKNIHLISKLNIIFTWIMPTISYKLKCTILGRKV